MYISDIAFESRGVVISVKYTKTLQFKKNKLDIPIPSIGEGIGIVCSYSTQLYVDISRGINSSAALFSYNIC